MNLLMLLSSRILPSESFKLSLDDADESGRCALVNDRCGNNKTSLLCNGGGITGGVNC